SAGIDIGSLSTKCAFYDGSKMIGYFISRSGHEFERVGSEVYQKALEAADLKKSDVDIIIGTGYGRYSINFGDKTITEISAHAKGANFFFGDDIRFVIDIGGQDSKAIVIGKNGKVLDFAMNDKCAAGTGRFLEVMANALSVNINDMGKLSSQSKDPAQISSMCTVFAESEIISLFSKGTKKEDIIAGIHRSIAKRVVGMAKRLPINDKVVFQGGVAKNEGVRKAIEEELKRPIYSPEDPQISGAIGAAVIGFENLTKKK
ncbi:MAG: acyl-CoA dehydratase activase, partial [Candidatus Helarchaeota archaeon]